MELNWNNYAFNATPALLVKYKEGMGHDNLIPLCCEKFEAVGLAKQLLMTAPLATLYEMESVEVVDLDLEYGYYSDRGGEEGDQYDDNVFHGFYMNILSDVLRERTTL